MPLMPEKNWREKLRESARDFLEIVWPKIKHWFGDGELIPVEAVTESEMAKCLDRNAGIDAWYIETDQGIRGIASRVQWGKDYGTFTVRVRTIFGSRTEYQKLNHAIKNDWLYPFWFCQAYLSKTKRFLNAARCQTKHLIEYIEGNPREIENNIKTAHTGRKNDFCCIEWNKFRVEYPIDVYDDIKKIESESSQTPLTRFLPNGGMS